MNEEINKAGGTLIGLAIAFFKKFPKIAITMLLLVVLVYSSLWVNKVNDGLEYNTINTLDQNVQYITRIWKDIHNGGATMQELDTAFAECINFFNIYDNSNLEMQSNFTLEYHDLKIKCEDIIELRTKVLQKNSAVKYHNH